MRTAPNAAVVSGSRPTTTAACAVEEVSRARVVNNGKPVTMPPTTTASPGQWRLAGNGARNASRQPAATRAASTDLIAIVDQGPSPLSAQAVAGKVSEKVATPRTASSVPSRAPVGPVPAGAAPLCAVSVGVASTDAAPVGSVAASRLGSGYGVTAGRGARQRWRPGR